MLLYYDNQVIIFITVILPFTDTINTLKLTATISSQGNERSHLQTAYRLFQSTNGYLQEKPHSISYDTLGTKMSFFDLIHSNLGISHLTQDGRPIMAIFDYVFPPFTLPHVPILSTSLFIPI